MNSAGVRGTDTAVGQGTRVAGPWDPSRGHGPSPGKSLEGWGAQSSLGTSVGLSRGSGK